MDNILLQRSRESLGHSADLSFIEGDPGALLAVEFYGESEAELIAKTRSLKDDIEGKGLAYACVNVLDQPGQNRVWNLRKGGLGLLMSIHGDAKPLPFVEDTAVDPEKLGPFVRRFDEIVRSHGTEAAYYGHASVGCLHIRPLVSLKDSQGVATMVAISDEISDLVKEFGGSLSGEHGDGIVRGVYTEKMFGPEIYQAFQELKNTFDPQGIMNPGKIINCPPMTENLRYGPDYQAHSITSKLDFSTDTNFAGAVEMCNGMGACRKLEGTMCPSYMATREEEHSTRGRANALRAVFSGLLPPEEFTSHRMYQVMDLCLECKGCKAECPSQVDMAKLKYEFLDAYHQKHGYPLRSRLFANIGTLSKWGSTLAPMSNWGARFPLTRWILDHFLKIDKRRPLPPFARRTFPSMFRSRSTLFERQTQGEVVLFNDTFMNYNYPSIGMAATTLLERAGFHVTLVDRKCCGRPMISKGMLDKAKANAQYNVELLYPHVERGAYIVGCEPSCLLTLRDEYPDLLRSPEADKVAEKALLLEEFLQMLQQDGRLELKFKETPKKILFHNHCHANALVGTEPALAALRLVPGFQVEESDAGCCGMAGAFGYEKEHYDVSMTIGNQRLFPAVTSSGNESEAVITGISCRQQIQHGTGRVPRHLAEVLAEALA